MNAPVIYLMGATTTGKTRLAIDLCEKLPLDVISVDSAMVYRGMDIGTAKPGPEILLHTPHRLIDICDPSERYSAARFRTDAIREIEDIHAGHRIPLLVGGTGLYFRTLEAGISLLPDADFEIRSCIEKEASETGWKNIHHRLATIDPDAAEKIHPNDPQRILRAMEVYLKTGETLTAHFQQQSAQPLPYPIIKLILHTEDRKIIHNRIKQRFLEMLEAGLIEEVRSLYERGDLNAALPAMRMVGYRQIWRYFEHKLTYEEMVQHSIIATRQLAKRQVTWLRKEKNAVWFDCENRQLPVEILEFFRKNNHLSVIL